MNVYESIMNGLNEAVEYEKENKGARSVRITITPPPEVTASEIKEVRQNLKMTQRTFAAVMGVSNKTVEAWEKGTNTPTGTARRLIAMLKADRNIPEKYKIITY